MMGKKIVILAIVLSMALTTFAGCMPFDLEDFIGSTGSVSLDSIATTDIVPSVTDEETEPSVTTTDEEVTTEPGNTTTQREEVTVDPTDTTAKHEGNTTVPGNTDDEPEENTTAPGQSTTEPTTTNPVTPPVEPGAGDYDFGGDEFVILSRAETAYEFYSDGSLSGDAINRAVYERNTKIAKKYNAEIKVAQHSGAWEARSEFMSIIRNDVLADIKCYDLASTYSTYLGWLTIEGYAYDMTALPETDFTNTWWGEELYNEININGHVYFMIGDICVSTYQQMQVMYFNEDMFESTFPDQSADDIYQMVMEHEWIWEALFSYATDCDSENGYGLLTNAGAYRATFSAQNASLYTRSQDGKLELPDNLGEKIIDILDQMVNFYNREEIWFYDDRNSSPAEQNAKFSEGSSLFYSQTLGEAVALRSALDADLGIIPLPKHDADQAEYYTICNKAVSAIMILRSNRVSEMSGVLTEALCKESYDTVTPEYYDLVLASRNTADSVHVAMLDIIRSGLTIQVESCYMDKPLEVDMFLNSIMNGQYNFLSYYVAKSNMGQQLLVNLYDTLEENGLY